MKGLTALLAAAALLFACTRAPEPYGPVPSPGQLAWQKMEMNMFCHFGPNTFSGLEWGNGTEPEDIFNPGMMDCGQWVEVAKAGGFGGIIITAKHHDGFCLWPNPVSRHTVAQSSWRDGKGDVLKDLSEACAAGGVKFGVYVSPWDRNAPEYGTDAYNEVFRRTLEDVHTRYGAVFEQWFDGACGEGPSGRKQVYDWPLFHQEVWKHNPDAVIFSDVGPGCRWMGNERGIAGRTNWSRLDVEGFAPGAGAPPRDTLSEGNVHGAAWIPAEVDVSIRKGWFWHEDDAPKSLQDLLGIYYTSVGRNGLLLLNIPPDSRGLVCPEDSARVVEFRSALDHIFARNLAEGATVTADVTRGRAFRASNVLDPDYDRYWAAPDGCRSASITLELPEARIFNRILLKEYIPLGQRIAAFRIEARHGQGEWTAIASETTVGYKRIVLVDDCCADAVRIVIEDALACPVLNGVELYYDDIYKL